MKARIKKLWLEALRRTGKGAYKQGKDKLRSGDTFCCLGVLCDLHRKKTRSGRWDGSSYCLRGSEFDTSLPMVVQRWAGLDSSDPVIARGGSRRSASSKNDGGAPFSKIADLIEKNIPAEGE